MENYDENKNDEAMCLQLDLVDEVHATAEQRLARYQNLMAKHYNSKVRHRDFQVRNLNFKEGDGYCKRSYPRKAQPQLGRTLYNCIMAEERHLPPWNVGRAKVATSMECWAPAEVLPIRDDNMEQHPLIFQFTLVIFATFLKIFFFQFT